MPVNHHNIQADLATLTTSIKQWSAQLGFQQTGVTDTQLEEAGNRLNIWLAEDLHGDMEYMARHGAKRYRPDVLVPGTLRVISVRMDYWPGSARPLEQVLQQPESACISRYALGRDYHKLMRKRLQKLAERIHKEIGDFGYRVFVDSAPVMEKPLAQKAGLGWIGKHTNLIHDKAGSWFFLGELYTDLPLPVDTPAADHCGSCRSCIDICPTQAIIAPYRLDARRCISYLTIELPGAIPVDLRPLMGNHIYGCDDCQLVCPWNRFAHASTEQDFLPRQQLDAVTLVELFAWPEEEFLQKTEGSPIRRIGHLRWLRNIAVALGNCNANESVHTALQQKQGHTSELVREHISWALAQDRSI
jgi:epoxyqueuosine reductase